jgi:hypothetical protein
VPIETRSEFDTGLAHIADHVSTEQGAELEPRGNRARVPGADGDQGF